MLAVWLPLLFTAPAPGSAPIETYRVKIVDQVGYEFWPKVYACPSCKPDSLVVHAAGRPETLYISLSQDARPRLMFAYAQYGGGLLGPRSNGVVAAAGVRDTAYFRNETAPLWAYYRSPGAVPTVSWNLAYADSSIGAVETQEAVQRRYAARLCALYGHWYLRGLWQDCP